jgi:hypothetical protein
MTFNPDIRLQVCSLTSSLAHLAISDLGKLALAEILALDHTL